MQPLAGLERKGVLGGIHNLIGAADQMHFDAVQLRVPDRQMIERVKIEDALRRTSSRAAAAEMLGIAPRTLAAKMKELGLE